MSYPIGTEKTVIYSGRQYTQIKTAENPSNWELKHIFLYEQKHGKIKSSDTVIFIDDNPFNFELENLMVINKKLLSIIIKRNLPRNNKEELLVSIGIAKLLCEISNAQTRIKEEKKWEDDSKATETKDYKTRYKEIGLRVAYYRKLKGYSRLQLSEKTGIKQEYLNNLENPNKYIEPSLGALYRISDALDIGIEKLLIYT